MHATCINAKIKKTLSNSLISQRYDWRGNIINVRKWNIFLKIFTPETEISSLTIKQKKNGGGGKSFLNTVLYL